MVNYHNGCDKELKETSKVMEKNIRKITIIIGFLNIALCITELLLGAVGFVVQKFYAIPQSTLIVPLYIKLFLIPIIWIIVCVIIQILFMKNKRNRRLVFGILLFALGFQTLFNIIIAEDYLTNNLIQVIICALAIVGFIIAIVAKELSKIARVIIMLGYAVMAAFKLYCVAATVLNLFNPKVIYGMPVWLVILYYVIRPIIYCLGMLLFTLWIIKPIDKNLQ